MVRHVINKSVSPLKGGIGQEIILILNILHASKVFMTPIANFEDTLDQQNTIAPTSLQILNQVKPMEEVVVEPVERAINQLVAKGQANLGL
jgi:hypothetical protein